MHTFNTKEFDIIVNGFRMEGLAEDTYFEAERAEDAFTMKSSADGPTTRSKTNNTSGTMTLRLMYSSESNALLTALAHVDEQTGHGVFPVLVKHRGTLNKVASGTAWIRKLPNMALAKEVGEVEWPIDCASMLVNFAGIPAETVG